MFCYKCGKETALIDGLCPECHAIERALIKLEQKYDIIVCKNCDTFLLGDWMPFSHVGDIAEKLLVKLAGKQAIEFVDEFMEPTHKFVQVKYSIVVHEEFYEVQTIFYGFSDSFATIATKEVHDFSLHFKYTVCLSCSKKYGGYYEAVFQVRKEGRFLTNDESELFIKEVYSFSDEEIKKNNMAFITQAIPKKEGVDFKMGSLKFTKKLARILQARYGGSVSESYRLCGFDRQGGKARYRTTIIFRMSQFEKGIFVFFQDKLWKVEQAIDKLTLRNFDDAITLDFKKVEKETNMGNLKIIESDGMREGILASVTNDGAELMAMDNYEVILLDHSSLPHGAIQGINVLFFGKNGKYYCVSP